jgi:hypothetical protein
VELGALCLILAAVFVWGTFSAKAAAISTPIFFVAIGIVRPSGAGPRPDRVSRCGRDRRQRVCHRLCSACSHTDSAHTLSPVDTPPTAVKSQASRNTQSRPFGGSSAKPQNGMMFRNRRGDAVARREPDLSAWGPRVRMRRGFCPSGSRIRLR